MISGVILDLDGTVYRGTEQVPGASAFIRGLRDAGIPYLYVTNRSNRSPETVCEQLRGFELDCEPEQVLTSAQATAVHLPEGSSAYVIGEEPLIDELRAGGISINDENPDYVVVSYDRQLTYEKLRIASQLIVNGAAYIATNPDRGLNTEAGVYPGTGSIVAAVTAVVRQEPLVIGKPERRIFDLALERMQVERDGVVAVGDNLNTDIPAAAAAGMKSAFILTGISTRDDLPDAPVAPTWTVDGFEELAAIIASENG